MTPEYDAATFEDLVNNIKENGIIYPIIVWNGYIVDGKHRYRAAQQLGLEPKIRDCSELNENELPLFILDIAMGNKGNSKNFAAASAVIYLEQVKDIPAKDRLNQKEIVERYKGMLTISKIKYMKKIYEEAPAWFTLLSQDKYVKLGDDKNGKATKNLREIYDYIKMNRNPKVYEKDYLRDALNQAEILYGDSLDPVEKEMYRLMCERYCNQVDGRNIPGYMHKLFYGIVKEDMKNVIK